jgi:hypothetical protein
VWLALRRGGAEERGDATGRLSNDTLALEPEFAA